MQVILLERVAKLGQMGDVVNVKDGFARNYLLPQGKALRATPENIRRFEEQKAQLEARNLELRREAEAVAEKLDGKQFVIIRAAADTGALYGSVTARDIANAMTEDGFTVDRRQVTIDRPIKELGLHEITVRLHPEVEVTVVANVARNEEEAKIQSEGKSVQQLAAEAEAAAELEMAELFEDIGAAALDEGDEGENAPAAETEAETGEGEEKEG